MLFYPSLAVNNTMPQEIHILLTQLPAPPNHLGAKTKLFLAKANLSKLLWHNPKAYVSNLFAYEAQTMAVAALTYLADGGQLDKQAWYLRCDPVHIRADRDRLLLFDAKTALDDLSQTEAEALIKSLNKHFADDNLTFFAPNPQRWYLRLDKQPQVNFTELEQVRGADVHDYMPDGIDKMLWRSYLNEIQMLLHDHEINLYRENNGLLSINSVWFWGLGSGFVELPNIWHKVWTNDILFTGLAMASQAKVELLPTQVNSILETKFDKQLLILDFAPNVDFWQELEQNWLAPLIDYIRHENSTSLVLHTEKTCLRLSAADLAKWWRWRINPKSLI